MVVMGKNMVSVMFFQVDLARGGFRTLRLLWTSSMEAFYKFLYIFFCFVLNLAIIHFVWEVTAKPFSCETPTVSCGLSNFTRPSISMRPNE